MLSIYCTLFIVITFLGAVCGDPTTQIILEKVDIKTDDNPFFDPWTASLTGSNEKKLTVTTPAKIDLPSHMMIRIVIGLDGNEMVNYQSTLCAFLEDESIGEGIVAHGLPKELFPKRCPIKSGADFEVNEWMFPMQKLPPGIPDGPGEGVMTIFEEGKPPIITLTVKGKVINEFPGIGR
ncbi:uncharacterized protein LOC107039472 [Diachasma alloeum]|uniref:uncharacterized protein LOC107039472 n=1 Tax=Diachasma alloeum TaxID=454923 RepID=UPI0007381397|nr:uncharacterized protein LOC107039472 [Diachasma alloeum]